MKTESNDGSALRRFSWGMNLMLFLALAVLFLVAERGVRVLGIWPILFLLACAGMHFFMHGSHGHGGRDHEGGHLDTKKNDAVD